MLARARRIRVLAVVAVVAVAAAGCGDSGSAGPVTNPSGPMTSAAMGVSARIKGSGATFPDAFYQEAVTGLHTVTTKLDVTYEALGSSAGREAFAQRLNDFAGTDSLVSSDDHIASGSFRYIPAVGAPIAVVANLGRVKNLRLNADTLAQIFQGDITRWNDPAIVATNPEVTLPDQSITVARRSDGSGTTKNFTRYLERASKRWRLGADDTVEWPARTEGGQQNTGVAQLVVDTPGAIGYIDYGNALELGLRPVAIENRAGNFVLPGVKSAQAALNSSEAGADLTFDAIDAPGGGAYPITAVTYILVRSHYGEAATGHGVVAFVRWLITEGAETYAAELGFAPVPATIRARALDSLNEVEIS